MSVKTLRPKQKDRYCTDEMCKCVFLDENVWISINISLSLYPNIPAWVKIMTWRRPGDKPLSVPMMASSLTHTCVTRIQWVVLYATSKAHMGLKMYLIYCSHVWGSTYHTYLTVVLVRKKLVRIITCFPSRWVHTESLMMTNGLMCSSSINGYLTFIFVYLRLYGYVPGLLISTPVTEIFMVPKQAYLGIYTLRREALSSDERVWCRSNVWAMYYS